MNVGLITAEQLVRICSRSLLPIETKQKKGFGFRWSPDEILGMNFA